MNLNEVPGMVNWPETFYVFLEKIGPFQNTAPSAWQELQVLVPEISKNNVVTGYMSLYKIAPKIYRAGVSVSRTPQHSPDALRFEKFAGGKYSRFVLTGPYSDLPAASERVFAIVAEKKIQMRDDYSSKITPRIHGLRPRRNASRKY